MTRLFLIVALSLAASAQTGPHRGLFTPSPPVTFVNENYHFNSASNDAHNAVAFGVEQPAGVNAGDRLFAYYGFDSATNDPTGGTTSCTDTQGNTYTSVVAAAPSAGGNNRMYAFTAVAGSTGADTVTCFNSVTLTSNCETAIAILEYIPASLNGTPVAQSTASGQSVGLTNTIVTSLTDTLVVMSMSFHGHSIQITSPAGFTNRIANVGTIEAYAADKISVAAGSIAVLTSITGADVPLFTTVVAIH